MPGFLFQTDVFCSPAPLDKKIHNCYTKYTYLIHNIMTKIIGVKQLREQLPKIAKEAAKGQSFLVMRHQKILFRLEPPGFFDEPTKKQTTGKQLLEEFKKMQFSAPKGNKNLSKNIDKIVYGL